MNNKMEQAAADELTEIFEKLDVYLQRYDEMKPGDLTEEMLMEHYGWTSPESVRNNMKRLIEKGVVKKVRVNDITTKNKYRVVYRIIDK